MTTQNDLFGPITQIAYITPDIESTASSWIDTTGVGPWTIMRNVTLPALMDGTHVEFKIDVGLAYQNDIQIELIQPTCKSPSPYSEMVKAGIWGLHHLQFTTSDLKAATRKTQSAGMEPACVIDAAERGLYTYFRGPAMWFEVMQSNPQLDELFAMIKTKSVNWDGENPIQELSL